MPSFGEELRRERELRQITLREVSEATKINIRYLEALERNDFRHLPGGVFNKGFVKAFAQFIGVDPETMVNAYLLEEQAQLDSRGENLNHDVFRPAPSGPGTVETAEAAPDKAGPDRNHRIAVVVAVAAAVVLVIAVATVLALWVRSGPAEAEGATAAPTRQDERPPDPTEPTGAEGPPESVQEAAEPVGPEGTTPSDESPEVSPATPEDVPAAESSAPQEAGGEIRATIVLRRNTGGRINCDNKRIEILDGMAAGTRLSFECARFLLVDARDGGAVLLGLGGASPSPLGPDGEPARTHRFVSSGETNRRS